MSIISVKAISIVVRLVIDNLFKILNSILPFFIIKIDFSPQGIGCPFRRTTIIRIIMPDRKISDSLIQVTDDMCTDLFRGASGFLQANVFHIQIRRFIIVRNTAV